MHRALTSIHGVDELDTLLAESGTRPLFLFKHSYSCGVSAEALDELIDHLGARHAGGSTRWSRFRRTAGDVSNAVAARLGIRHETPQAIVVRDGRVVWSASHFRVNASSIDKALQSVAS